MFHRKEAAGNGRGAGKACSHMVASIEHLADGTARGPLKWLAEQHVAQCPRCAAALQEKRQGLASEAVVAPRQV